VEREVEMFELSSKSRQRECVVTEMVRESVSSRQTGMTERASSVCLTRETYSRQSKLRGETISITIRYWILACRARPGVTQKSFKHATKQLQGLNAKSPTRTSCVRVQYTCERDGD